MTELVLQGTIKQGLGIASGLSAEPKMFKGIALNATIQKQKPFFIQAGIEDMSQMYNGTINVDISPSEFKILNPDHEITCTWIEDFTETFWLVGVSIEYEGNRYDGYIYYPCPSEAKSHPDDTLELLSERIPGITYGQEITIRAPSSKITLV